MNIIQCDSISNSQKKDIFNIWNTTYPDYLVYSNHEDFEIIYQNWITLRTYFISTIINKY